MGILAWVAQEVLACLLPIAVAITISGWLFTTPGGWLGRAEARGTSAKAGVPRVTFNS